MPAEHFYCPHCHSRIAKTAQAYVMGEMMANQNSRFIGLGGMAETITCPICRGAIDAGKMLRGEFDVKRGGGWGWPLFAAIVTFFFAKPEFYDGYGWSSNASYAMAAALAVGVGFVLYVVLAWRRKSRQPGFMKVPVGTSPSFDICGNHNAPHRHPYRFPPENHNAS